MSRLYCIAPCLFTPSTRCSKLTPLKVRSPSTRRPAGGLDAQRVIVYTGQLQLITISVQTSSRTPSGTVTTSCEQKSIRSGIFSTNCLQTFTRLEARTRSCLQILLVQIPVQLVVFRQFLRHKSVQLVACQQLSCQKPVQQVIEHPKTSKYY